MSRQRKAIRARDFHLPWGCNTLVMGVLNLTPDSFSGDGRLAFSQDPLVHRRYALRLVQQGADILDIGAESSRPNAPAVSADMEICRLLPVLRRLKPASPVPISVDTRKIKTARAALDAGADIINTIHGTPPDKALVKAVRDHGAALVLMHMRGTPRTMQRLTRYRDVVKEVGAQLRRSVDFCLDIGLKRDRIIIDPGLGFAKTSDQNLEILNRLEEFAGLGLPILVGPSRKSFIGKVLGTEVDERLWGTAGAVAVAVSRGASIVRVHDIPQIKQVAKITDAILNA